MSVARRTLAGLAPAGRLSSRPVAALVAVLAVLLAASACTVTKNDDETSRPVPTRTTTITPTPPPVALPARIPVGHGPVTPADVVWAQAGTLHVGSRSWNLAPRTLDSFVVVRGGVYFLDRQQLWFTDLRTVRPTGVTGATTVATDASGSGVRVTVSQPGRSSRVHVWSAITGATVPPRSVSAATGADYHGTPAEVRFPAERRDTHTFLAPVQTFHGTGGYGVYGDDEHPVVAYQIITSEPVTLRHVVGNGFELVRWTSATTFYGLALDVGKPLAAIGCDIKAATCTTYGEVQPGLPLVFQSGT